MKYGYVLVGAVAGGVTYAVLPETTDQWVRAGVSFTVFTTVTGLLYWWINN